MSSTHVYRWWRIHTKDNNTSLFLYGNAETAKEYRERHDLCSSFASKKDIAEHGLAEHFKRGEYNYSPMMDYAW